MKYFYYVSFLAKHKDDNFSLGNIEIKSDKRVRNFNQTLDIKEKIVSHFGYESVYILNFRLLRFELGNGKLSFRKDKMKNERDII